MIYKRCGRSGLMLPVISLGLWQNFSQETNSYDTAKEIILKAYDKGIVHFDLANNYGPPPGAAERTFGRILKEELSTERNKMVITSKAGHLMWDGVYGDWGSRKHIIASCDESLQRLGVDYVDIFYSHRYDPETPLEETMGALDFLLRSGRALYVGLSKYPADKMRKALKILHALGTPVIVNQLRYSMLVRDPEIEIFDVNRENGLGCVSFSPLAQGQLSDKYLNSIPSDSRALRNNSTLNISDIENNRERTRLWNDLAKQRGQTLSQMAIAWQIAKQDITSVIIGVSSVAQLEQNLGALDNTDFSQEELQLI